MPNSFTTTTATGASSFNAANWLRARLPDGYDFSRNSVTVTMTEAIADALALYADKAQPHYWAAWDLFDRIASGTTSETVESESLDGYSYKSATKSSARDKAAYYLALAEASETEDALEGTSGTFQMVDGVYGNGATCDENSR